MDLKLIKNSECIDKEKVTLLCLPFAGGGASVYNQWVIKMKNAVTVCPIQLPGREERITETPYIDMTVLLDDLEDAFKNTVKGSYTLWGHSMGGKIAYELEKRLEENGYTAQCLFVSGSRIPSIPEPKPIYHLPDEIFKKELGRFQGTPKEILENQELLDFFLPMLRADFTMDETYYTKEVVSLKCPIIAFGGTEDKEANEKAIKAWNQYTIGEFQYQLFQGDHFYIKDHEERIINKIISICREAVEK